MCVYLLDRQAESAYFMAPWMVGHGDMRTYFGVLGNHLPTLLHVYAFTMLTIAVVSPSRVSAIAICVAFFVADSLFELAQITVIAQEIAKYVPEWFQGVPFLENTSSYFLAGTFDVRDLISIAIGSLAAYLTYVASASPRS